MSPHTAQAEYPREGAYIAATRIKAAAEPAAGASIPAMIQLPIQEEQIVIRALQAVSGRWSVLIPSLS